jgi:hypothetical protein
MDKLINAAKDYLDDDKDKRQGMLNVYIVMA